MTVRRPKSKTDASKPLPSSFAGPSESAGFLLWKVSNAWQRQQRSALLSFGLTHSQFVVLASAVWFGASESLTQARLSVLSGVDVMTTSQIVRALEANGLVARREHPDDSRAKRITVTEAGRALASAAIKVVEQTDATFFAPASKDMGKLLGLLQALIVD
jgi:DNA-binding MarR family transcriptional regulator